jgi:hypothetical protein
MKTRLLMMLVCVLILAVLTGYGQMIKRADAIYARVAPSAITLDGKLTEAAWATAESLKVKMGQDNGMPGSGWVWENGLKFGEVSDPTDATVKFLVYGDSLYVAVICKDKSIGGGLFNQFDGLLMNLRYKAPTGDIAQVSPKKRDNQANEIFYGWVTEGWASDSVAGYKDAKPGFYGDFGNRFDDPPGTSVYHEPRPDSLKAFWDGATFVQGTTNDDATPDTAWTTELKFNLKAFNYNPQQPGGDIAMFGIQIYDADYEWPLDTLKQSGNRVWLQSPWGNASAYNHIRVFIDPSVTSSSGAVPTIGPDYTIPNGKDFAAPTIDGKLDENVWKAAGSLQIKYGDAAIRNAYANTAKWRSGQVQATVNGGKGAVLDPNLATVKYFFKDDFLYLGFDVKDKFVQWVDDFDRWDGFRVTMDQRDARNGDSVLAVRRFTFRVDSTGKASREEDLSLSGWDSLKTAITVALALKNGTTVDTLGASADSGYTAEMKIDLQKMGYPAGRGDGVVFLGICEFDGDSFSPASSSYGTRTWFMRQGDWDDGAAWMYMDPSVVADVKNASSSIPDAFALLGNFPNPFNPSTTIRFTLSRASEVTMDVYDVLGRMVSSRTLGNRTAGTHSVSFDATNLASGTYYYRLKQVSTGASLVGKMMLLK